MVLVMRPAGEGGGFHDGGSALVDREDGSSSRHLLSADESALVAMLGAQCMNDGDGI